jgi:hypothetical protein
MAFGAQSKFGYLVGVDYAEWPEDNNMWIDSFMQRPERRIRID